MFMNILVSLLLIIAGILGYAATRPDSFRVERSVKIQAPPDKVIAAIDDFKRWAEWSPWEKIDPTMQRGYSGPPQGVGTVYTWEGSGKVGAGRMEILESSPNAKVKIKLDFSKPFEAHNTAEFTLATIGNETQVTWAMFGPSPFISKVMGIFFNMDKMIGKDFETGLSNLKTISEK